MKVQFSIVSAAFCGPFGSLMAHKKFQSPSSFLSIRASRLYFDQKCQYLVPSPTQMSPLRSPSLAQDQPPWSPRQNRMTPFGHGKSFGTIFKNIRSTQRSRTWWRGCRRPKTISRSEIVILVLKMRVTCFQLVCFWARGIIWDHFYKSQIDLKVKNRVEGLLEAKKDSME